MKCPLKQFGKCPQHNRENGGCAWWLEYANNSDTQNASVKGCAMTLTPMLLIEQHNNLGVVAGEINKVSAEISASRVEHIKEQQANREQLLNIASGAMKRVQVEHNTTMKLENLK